LLFHRDCHKILPVRKLNQVEGWHGKYRNNQNVLKGAGRYP
jgi:hypothetical protein